MTRPRDEPPVAALVWRLLPRPALPLCEQASETILPSGQTLLFAVAAHPSYPRPHCHRPSQFSSAVLRRGPPQEDEPTGVNVV